MITFKQFLLEIDFDDGSMAKHASHISAEVNVNDPEWKPLPLKLGIPGFSCKWRHYGKDFKIIVIDDKKNVSAVLLQVVTQQMSVPNGKLIGVETLSLTSRNEYRGKGLPLALYSGMVKNGQVLFSSTAQTTGSRKLWENLTRSGVGEVFVGARDNAADWYNDRYGKGPLKTINVLLTGDMDRLEDEAYASSETRWVIVPKNLPGLDKIKAAALNISKKSDDYEPDEEEYFE